MMSLVANTDADIVWTVSRLGRRTSAVVLVLCALGFVAGVVTAIVAALTRQDAVDPAGVLMVALPLTLPGALVAWLWGLRPRIVASPDQLVVRNPLRSRRIPWGDVESADPGYSGIVIRRRSGGAVVAMAAQKSNLASWSRNSSTRADEIARTIEARRDRAQPSR